MSDGLKSTTILAIASNGGHWQQMQQIAPSFEGANVIFASTGVGSSRASDKVFHADIRLTDYNQNEMGKVFRGFFEAVCAIYRVKPNVVISTGAAPGLMCLLVGRLYGAKTIWLDSIANSEELSMSGRLAKKICHTVLTQWEHLSEPGKVQYWGSVL